MQPPSKDWHDTEIEAIDEVCRPELAKQLAAAPEPQRLLRTCSFQLPHVRDSRSPGGSVRE
jgi:hypothetical protein